MSAQARIETLVAAVEALPDPRARATARELVEAVLDLHKAGLARALEVAPERKADLARDPAVAALLLLHGLHPDPLEVRVERALESVRPYLHGHGGDVRVLSTEDGVVRLALEGSCHGCPSSSETMRARIEGAVLDAAPDLAGLEVRGVEKTGAEKTGAPPPELIQLGRRA